MKIKLYQDYKDTEIEWLPEIPKHWEVHRAKSMFNKMSRPIALEDGIITVFRDGQVTLRENRRITGFTNAIEEYGYQGLRKGDLVFHAMDAFAGAVGVSDSDGKATAEYLVYTPINKRETHVPFYGLLLRQMALSGFVLALGKSVRERSPRFKHTKFVSLELPVPPLFEQKTIAHYLDTKTAQIDRKIDLLTQKATLYSNLKQSLINEAVTRGLDKTVPMKDSGIEWIGEVPEHWEIRRANDIAVQQKRKNIGLIENNLLSLSYGRIKKKDIDTSFGLLPESFETYQIVEAGNIILRLTDLQNDQRSLRVGLAKERGIITSAYLCLRFLRNVHPVFAYYLLFVYDISKVFYWFGGGLRQSMKFDDIKVFPFVLPPLSEQKAIADYLDTKTAQIDQIIQTINTQIERLKELRKTLINDVVTGKIKVVENEY